MNDEGWVSFVEIGAEDAHAASQFFAACFGWRFTALESGGGWFEAGGRRIGLHGNDPEWGIVPFFHVKNIEQSAARVRTLGGAAEEIAFEEGFGAFCVCRAPQGARFGLHQPVGSAPEDGEAPL